MYANHITGFVQLSEDLTPRFWYDEAIEEVLE
jgi:hypothetical protein